MSRGKGRQAGRFSTPSLIEPLETRRLLSSENLDPVFGSQGATVVDFGPYTISRASLVDSNGNILVAGSQGSNAFVARFDANGNLDPSFGNQGIAKLDLGRNEQFDQLAQIGGDIIVAGNTGTAGRQRGFLARYTSAGQLETGFGHGDGTTLLPGGQTITAMTVAGGKIFTIGGSTLRRHNGSTGTADSGFGIGGQIDLVAATVLDDFQSQDLAISPSGQIAMTGSGRSTDPAEKKLPQQTGPDASIGESVIVLDSAGNPDAAFDANGVVFFDNTDFARAIYGPGGQLYVESPLWGGADIGNDLFTFQPDGTYTVAIAPEVVAGAMAMRTLAGGKLMMSDGSGTARFNADGSLDFSYSNDGTIQTTSAPVNLPLPLAGYTPTASGITSDGAVIMTGNYDVMGTNIPGPLVLYKVLANPPTLSIAANLGLDGTLNITGSPGDDTVWVDDDITNHRLQVQIDLQLYYFLDSAVHQITARLGDGNDAYHGAHEQLVAPTQFVDGEAGNDTIEGGSGNDTLLGGLGNDLILGGIGDDSLYGNGGKDTLAGEGGRDRIDGGRSNDNLHGDAQDDVLIGGPGSDRLFGEGGDDHFSSADGERDSLYGGSGSDSSDADPGDVLASIETNAT